MTVTHTHWQASQDDERAALASGFMDAGMWAACNPDAILPDGDITVQLPVPPGAVTFGMKDMWLERVADSWRVGITEDPESGTRQAEKRFGQLRFVASITPDGYSKRLAARTMLRQRNAETTESGAAA